MKVAAIVTAAGIGKRMGAQRAKQYLEVADLPIIVHTLRRFAALPDISEVVITVPPEDVDSFRHDIIEPFELPAAWKVVAGGEHRQQSVQNGLNAVSGDCDIVVIHDGVRPFVRESVIRASIEAARKHGASLVAMPLKETIKRVEAGMVVETADRSVLWGAQTPQTFRFKLIREAHERAAREGVVGTDDAMLVERMGEPVVVVEGDYRNIKITTKDDLTIAEAISKEYG